MKKILLTQGQVTLIDNADFNYLNQWKWYASYHPRKKTFVAVRKEYQKEGQKSKNIFMHREIMRPSNKEVVDHIDHNPLNNQRKNLRNCTLTQNLGNMKTRKDNHSGFKGVAWDKSRNNWQAKINYKRKSFFIGRFNDPKQAAVAYDKKAKELFGEFAKTNF